MDGKTIKRSADGIKCDERKYLVKCGLGWTVYVVCQWHEPLGGERIGQILLPEVCSNLCLESKEIVCLALPINLCLYVETKRLTSTDIFMSCYFLL